MNVPAVPAIVRRAWRGIKYRGYGQGWLNRASRKRFEARRPALNELQARVVEDLRRDGFATADVRELVPDLWPAAAEAGRAFVASERVQRGIGSYRPGEGHGKDYIVRLHEARPALAASDPWLRLGLSPALLDTVGSYLGLWPKLNYVDVWYTIPSPVERRAQASQRWHRDPEDERLVKVFLYLSDVGAGAGPLEYVRGSHGLGRWAGLFPNPDPGTASYPDETELEARIPAADRVLATGPAGTLVFCDTWGFHRGGLATEQPRVLATWSFVTPASIFARRFDVAGALEMGEAAELAIR